MTLKTVWVVECSTELHVQYMPGFYTTLPHVRYRRLQRKQQTSFHVENLGSTKYVSKLKITSRSFLLHLLSKCLHLSPLINFLNLLSWPCQHYKKNHIPSFKLHFYGTKSCCFYEGFVVSAVDRWIFRNLGIRTADEQLCHLNKHNS